MKTQSSALTWTWTLDFDKGFVNLVTPTSLWLAILGDEICFINHFEQKVEKTFVSLLMEDKNCSGHLLSQVNFCQKKNKHFIHRTFQHYQIAVNHSPPNRLQSYPWFLLSTPGKRQCLRRQSGQWCTQYHQEELH